MATSALLRTLRRPSSIPSLRYAVSLHCQPGFQDRQSAIRQFSIINDISKQFKEAQSNPEFQKSLKELNDLKEDFKVRTKKTTEKLHKSVDGAWTEAEATSKKVTANVKEKLSAATEEATANVKEKLSAATEEVKETLGLGKQESSESTGTSTSSFRTKDDSYSEKDGSSSTAGEGSSQSPKASTKESVGHSDTLFGKIKSSLSSASPTISLAFQKLKQTKVSDFAKKGYDIVKEELSSNPSSKRRMQYTRAPDFSGVRSTKTDVVIVPSKQSPLGEKWEAFKKKMKGYPVFKRVSGLSEPVVTKGQELAEDMRDRWETSDHPVVHKIQDLNESVFGETATALSFKEIRRRDPYFSLPDFVAEVQEMVRPVLNAYLKCDTETLKKYCSPEVIERCQGERKAFESQDMFFDTKILHISEVDVRETKMMGSTPIIIIGFQTQQIYCIRDKEGSIKAGGKDAIQTVHYAWAMQQMDIDELGDGALYPVFRLREMQQIGVQSLI